MVKIKESHKGKKAKLQSQLRGELESLLGYRDDSPYKYNPYNVINSGTISMDNVSTPLLAINNNQVHYLAPNSGTYKFKGKKTLEIPLMQLAGTFHNQNNVSVADNTSRRFIDPSKFKELAKAMNKYARIIPPTIIGMKESN